MEPADGAQCHQSDARRHGGARRLRGIPSALNSPAKKGRPFLGPISMTALGAGRAVPNAKVSDREGWSISDMVACDSAKAKNGGAAETAKPPSLTPVEPLGRR